MAKWGRMLVPASRDPGRNIDMWAVKPTKERKLRERVYKGIPNCWRTAAWEVLMCRYSRTGKTELRQLMSEYYEALDKPSSYDVQIDLDVPRTISGHVMFRTRYGHGCVLAVCFRRTCVNRRDRGRAGNGHYSTSSIHCHYDATPVGTAKGWGPSPRHCCAISSPSARTRR